MKLIIVTAPSGSGKTTIVKHLLSTFDNLAFSVSATTRPPRKGEVHGKDYYFISPEEFREHVKNGDFLEWEEVYENQYYGTLRSEVERLWKEGKHVIFDIDVQGALNLKEAFPDKTLTIFVKPPSTKVLSERLRRRKSESEESLKKRIAKAEFELSFANNFDVVIVNDKLEEAFQKADAVVGKYIGETEKN
ncbi:MAG: guanylate kinase [Saprospiraceae bacterium]